MVSRYGCVCKAAHVVDVGGNDCFKFGVSLVSTDLSSGRKKFQRVLIGFRFLGEMGDDTYWTILWYGWCGS